MSKEKRLSFDNVSVFPLGKIISGLRLKEKDNMPVMNVCEKYEKLLNKGQHAFQLCETFTRELSAVANTDITRSVVNRCRKLMSVNERDINNMCAVASLYESNLSYVAANVEEKMCAYLIDKSEKNRNELHESAILFAGNPYINRILENLSYDEYEVKHGKELNNLKSVSVKEERTYTEAEVNELINERMQEIEKNKSAKTAKGSFKDIDTHIELDKTIKNILENCGNNKNLANFCMNYYSELNRGISQEALYEAFISGISNWNYMPAVDTQISALKDRTSKYKQEIDLKRILETMSQCGSYYIVPLIEECVLDYMNDKSLANKAILKQRLYPFEYDPFVRDIENILLYDLSIPNTVYLGESVEKKNNYVHSELVYSPVLYIKENESVFNVKGMYYVKKGNSISRLPKKDIAALPESFTALCKYINSPAVQILSETNEIKVYNNADVAVISENEIKLNDKKMTTKELDSLCENYTKMDAEKVAYFRAVKFLNEKFNDIAYIDFVKHVAINEDAGHYVDVFRIKNNLFVTTVDKTNGISTFYKNVNPIQCRKYINEHMQLNVGELFEDILPSQESVKRMIMEKRALYEGYIEELQDKRKDFEELSNDPDADSETINKALQIIDDELDKAKKDYADYTKDTDDYLNGKSDDAEKSTDTDAADYMDKDSKEPENTETPAEMSTPIEDETDIDSIDNIGDDAVFPRTTASAYDETQVSDFDGLLDTPGQANDDSYKIVDIKYNYNVKADKSENKGELIVIVPTVDMNGDIHNDMKRVSFYLDDNGKPVINNEYMPLDMYKAIINAINEHPKTAEIINGMKSGNIAHRTANPEQEDQNPEPSVAVVTKVEEPEDSSVLPAEDSSTVDNVDNSDASLDDILKSFEEDDEFDLDSLLNDDNLSDENDNTADASTADASIGDSSTGDSSTGNTENKDNEPVKPVEQESPAEQSDKSDEAVYPINVPLNPEDIKPITKKMFQEALDEAGIKYGQSESNANDMFFTISNKAEAFWLKNYFKEWKGYSDAEFNNFFPELKACMDNKGQIPTMKLESIILPYNEDYAKLFNLPEQKNTPNAIKMTFESFADKTFVYNKLYEYAKTHELDENAKTFIEKYEKDLKLEESVIRVPYSNFLVQKLNAAGIETKYVNEDLFITVNSNNGKKAKAIMESFYQENKPESVTNFINDFSLNENIKITIENDKGEKVTINSDDLNSDKKEKKESENPDDNFDPDKSFEAVTTFDASESENPFKNPEDGDEDDDKEKDDKKNEEPASVKDEKEDKEDTDKKEEDKEDDKEDNKDKSDKKKKIVIKKKAKGEKNESVAEPDHFAEILNEGAKPTVYDNVKLNDGRRGQILYQMANGNFIVNVSGRTVECAQNEVSMVVDRPDTVDAPYKFDPATLKGLFEQYVHCGMYMNDIRMTPDDCMTKYSDYVSAEDTTKIPVLVEGQKLLIDRKYIRILENVGDFANIPDYKKVDENTYYNTRDYKLAESKGNMNNSVRTLINKSGKWELVNNPAGTFMND